MGVLKPDPRAYEIVIKYTGFKPDEMIFIDDSNENIDAAGKLGFKTVLACGSESIAKGLEDHGIKITL